MRRSGGDHANTQATFYDSCPGFLQIHSITLFQPLRCCGCFLARTPSHHTIFELAVPAISLKLLVIPA